MDNEGFALKALTQSKIFKKPLENNLNRALKTQKW